MKREVNGKVFSAAKRLFGSWNKAVESCGIKPNGKSFRTSRISCSDGHVVRSLSEKIIDEWLSNNGVDHEIERPYPIGKYTCDFYLLETNTWVEYFGFAGHLPEYDEAMRIKTGIAKEHDLNLISLFPKHLYPECKLSEMLPVSKLTSHPEPDILSP